MNKELIEKCRLTDEEIAEQLIKSEFLFSYAEHLSKEELGWWQDMCNAQLAKAISIIRAEKEQLIIKWLRKCGYKAVAYGLKKALKEGEA